MDQQRLKNYTILTIEFLAIGLMVFGLLPRELALVLTGILLLYFIFEPIEESLWVFLASIPLFVALPISGNLDTLANWRILILIIFTVLFFRQGIGLRLTKKRGKWKIKNRIKYSQTEYLVIIFLIIACFSLLAADNIWLGLKKIVFLVNAFLLFWVIKVLAFKNPKILRKVLSGVKTAIGITLGIGFLQLGMVFFLNLHQFWHLWDRYLINVFYGIDLSNLLSYSNTWFSYYSYQLPTLRMFSIFPDSHSFSFFCILSLPIFLTAIYYYQKRRLPRIINYFFLIICLLAIIFSGSRGAWVGAGAAFGFFLLLLIAYCSPKLNQITGLFKAKNLKNYRRKIQLIFFTLILFLILLPIASSILFMPQYIQLGEKALGEKISAFERAKSIIDFDETSIRGRLEIWQRTADSIIMRPLLGVGIGNYPSILNQELSFAERGSSAHSLYLEVAAEMGIFALIILLVIFYQILKRTWMIFAEKIAPEKQNFIFIYCGFLTLALVWIFSYSIFDIVLFNDKVLLFFVAIIAILYSFNYESD